MRVTLHRRSFPIAQLVFLNLLGISIAWSQESWTDAFRARRFADAVAISERQLKQAPRDPTLWTKRALALEGLGRNAESMKSFQRALELRPTFIPALEGAAEVAYKTHDVKAQSLIAKLLQTDPRNTTAHAMAGVLAFEKHDCNTAMRYFEKAGSELAKNQQAYSFFGACLLELNNAQKAVLVFTTLLKQFPESVNVRYNLGYAQLLNGNAGDAVVTLRPLTIGERPDASAINLMASAEAADGDLAAALNDLRRAAQLKPDAEENYLDFATLCLEHDSLDLAEEIVNIGLHNIPGSARLYSMRGIINAQKSKFDESANDFEQANRLSPQKLYGSVGLSVLYAESKHPEESERILRSKLQMAPDDATLNYLLADVLVNQPSGATDHDLAQGKAALLRSVAARPDFSNAHALLGKVYRRTGENAKAIEQLKLALSHDPQNRVALNQIVSLLRAVGRAPEAAPYSASLRRVLQQEVSTDVDQARVRIVRVQ
jgi:tetratricopeptide (TPR) repeat protein